MKMQEVYETKAKREFLDVVELLREIRKDEKNFRVPDEDAVLPDLIFNPLLKEYYAIKSIYAEKQKQNPESFTKRQLSAFITDLVKRQPNYEDAMTYVLWEESENKLNSIEKDEEEDEL